MSVLDGHLSLFKLAWVSDPQRLKELAEVTGVTDPYVAEMAAWCMELHTHFMELAEQRDMPLLLMGGNGAALRVEVAKQRGSADNDYLTSASEQDIAALVDAFAARFAEIEEPFFRPQLIEYTRDEPLPLRSYKVIVPELYAANPAHDGQLMVKIEFHIEKTLALPPSERLSAQSGAVGEAVDADLPLVPYQVGLKLMTLVAVPVGIDTEREASVPRQIYDLDALFQKVDSADGWAALHDYAEQRYANEVAERKLPVTSGEPWKSVDARLELWSDTKKAGRQWRLIDGFQSAQVGGPTKRTPPQWRARVQRVRVAARCAAMGADGFALWQRALATEALLPETSAGPELKRGRRVLAPLAGVAPAAFQSLRNYFWEALAGADSLADCLDELDSAVQDL